MGYLLGTLAICYQETPMPYWLFKSEPFKWSWDQQKAEGGPAEWDGIRNYQARNNMRMMQKGDLGFFYHSNEGLDIVGVVEVSIESAQDTTVDDVRWDCVHVTALKDMPEPVSLADVKADPKLKDMSLVTSMRLSVQPVTEAEWKHVCKRGGFKTVPLAKTKKLSATEEEARKKGEYLPGGVPAPAAKKAATKKKPPGKKTASKKAPAKKAASKKA